MNEFCIIAGLSTSRGRFLYITDVIIIVCIMVYCGWSAVKNTSNRLLFVSYSVIVAGSCNSAFVVLSSFVLEAILLILRNYTWLLLLLIKSVSQYWRRLLSNLNFLLNLLDIHVFLLILFCGVVYTVACCF